MNIDISQTSDGKNWTQSNGESLRLRGSVLKFQHFMPRTCRRIVVDIPHVVSCHIGMSIDNIDTINESIPASMTGKCYAMFPEPEKFFCWCPTVRSYIKIADQMDEGKIEAAIWLAEFYEKQFGIILEPVSFVTPGQLPQIISQINYI